MGKGSDWPAVPAGPGTVGGVGSGVSAAAGPAAAASPAQTDRRQDSVQLTSQYNCWLHYITLMNI